MLLGLIRLRALISRESWVAPAREWETLEANCLAQALLLFRAGYFNEVAESISHSGLVGVGGEKRRGVAITCLACPQ